MTPAFTHLAILTDKNAVSGKFARLTDDAANDFHKDKLPKIPAGTILQIDFAGDFGLYAVADVDGVLHKVKIELPDLHKIELL